MGPGFISALVLMVAALVALIVRRYLAGDEKNAALYSFYGLFVSSLLVLACSSWTIVNAGEVAVPIRFGKVLDRSYQNGINIVEPWVDIIHMSVRTHAYVFSSHHDEGNKAGDDSLDGITSDNLVLKMDITVPYRLSADAAGWVYRNFGQDDVYVEKILRPTIATAVRDATGHFTAHDAYSAKREDLANKIKEKLEQRMKEVSQGQQPFEFFSVLIRSVTLPEQVLRAMEEKQKADLAQQQMDYVLQKETKLADQRRIEAKGIQDFQNIVSHGVTPDMLEWKRIEAQFELAKSSNTKIIVVPMNMKDQLILNTEK